MMSFFALTGLAAFSFGGGMPESLSEETNSDDIHGELDLHGDEPLVLGPDLLADFANPAVPDIYDFARGDMIAGFNPKYDVLELEYSRALGIPEITVTDFPDGSGASIALNGVVVADVEGAQGLNPATIMLRPV